MTTAGPRRLFWRRFAACALLVSPFAGFAEEAAAPNADTVLSDLAAIPPEALAARVQELKAMLGAIETEAGDLAKQSEAAQAEAGALDARYKTVAAALDALLKAATPAEPMAEAQPAAEGAMMTAEPAMAAPAEGAMNVEEAAATTPPAVTFADHIAPIFKARCARCHNASQARGGLALDTYAKLMEGGGSGEVIALGDADGSRLFRLVLQTEEPKMPPSGDPLNAEELELIRTWIALGAPENSGSKVMTAKKIEVGGADAFVAAVLVDGPPPMPEVAVPAPVVTATRGVVARALATSPTAPLAAVGGDRQVILYNLETFAVIGALPFPEGDIFTLSFSVSGELLLAGGGQEGDVGIAAIWHVRTTERVGNYGDEYDTILAGDISPDQRLVALGGPSRKVRVYSIADGAMLYELSKHTDWIYSVRFTPDGELLATADRQGGLYVWQAANGRDVEQLRGHTGPIYDLCYTPDSAMLISASEDGSVRIWDTWKYTQIRTFNAHGGAGVLSASVSPAGEITTSGKDGRIIRSDINGAAVGEYERLPDWAYQARFGRKGEVVLSGAWDGVVRAFDTATGERRGEFSTQPQPAVQTAAANDAAPQ